MWESLSEVTCCRSLVIIYDSNCVLQVGFAAESSARNGEAVGVDTKKLMQGSLYQGVMKSGARMSVTTYYQSHIVRKVFVNLI